MVRSPAIADIFCCHPGFSGLALFSRALLCHFCSVLSETVLAFHFVAADILTPAHLS